MKKLLVLCMLPLVLGACNNKEKQPTRDPNTVDYVLLAEPALTGVLKTTSTAKEYLNLQNEYKTKSNNLMLTQASVFVKNGLSDDVIHGGIENKLKSSINQMINTPDSIATYMNAVDNPETIFTVKPNIAVEVTKNGNRMGIGYKAGHEIKDDINKFASIFGAQQVSDENIIQNAGELADSDVSGLKFLVPTGAPAVAMAAFATYEGFETVTDPSTIVPRMANKSADVVVLPTNVGVTALVAKNVEYKLLGTITFGNLFIASTGNDDDGVMDEDDYIVSFQKGAVPDKIFHYIFGNTFDEALHYVASAQEAAGCLKTGKNLTDTNK